MTLFYIYILEHFTRNSKKKKKTSILCKYEKSRLDMNFTVLFITFFEYILYLKRVKGCNGEDYLTSEYINLT